MQTASELTRLSLILKLTGMLAEKQPNMTLASANPILTDLIIQALADGECEGSIESAAARIWSLPSIQDQIPPWEI